MKTLTVGLVYLIPIVARQNSARNDITGGNIIAFHVWVDKTSKTLWLRFWIRTPKQLWDWLPKIISRELKQPDTTDQESRCQACGERLRNLFGRAGKGMVDRTVLRALVDEICNEELYQS